MAGPTDHELIAELRADQREALGVLFDRYGGPLYEFIYRVVGDRDQAARLLEEVFARVPAALAGLGEHESVRGWLYSLARQASLNFLHQRNWLDALPPSEEPVLAGLAGSIWRAARAIPAFYRAVLVVEELHGLSPTEKARALDVARTDVPRLVEDARHAFDTEFDRQAWEQGHPLSPEVEPERQWDLHRRVGTTGSLFGYLPVIPLPESLRQTIRGMLTGMPEPPEQPNYPLVVTQQTLPPQPYVPPRPAPYFPEGCSVPVLLTALFLALFITAVAAFVTVVATRDTAAPVITQVDPPDRSTVTSTHVIIAAAYRDDRAIDTKSVRLVVDGRDITTQALVSDTGLTSAVDLFPGQHAALLEIKDTSGNRTSTAWQFSVVPPATPTITPSPTRTPPPTGTPLPTPTRTPVVAPVINSFTASQNEVSKGTPVLLAWNVTGADAVFLNQEKVDPVGSRVVTPPSTTLYHLIANNIAGTVEQSITVTILDLPDLVVGDISVNAIGQILYTIRNIGAADVTRNFQIQIFVDGVPVDSNYRVSALTAGQEVSLFVPNYTLTGTHAVTVRLNAPHDVAESNFNNNELTRTVNGPTPTPTASVTPSITPTPRPSATPTLTPNLSGVTGISISVTPISYTGACSASSFFFSATITTNGPATVRYHWVRSNGTVLADQQIFFANASSIIVTDTWNGARATDSWERLEIVSPNTFSSTNANFTNNCT